MQGFHIFAEDALIKKFNPKNAVNELLVHYNERKHTTARFAPRQIVERSKDSLFIQHANKIQISVAYWKKQRWEV